MADSLDYPTQRARMVERQLRRRGISDPRVLAAMGEVPRELFVPEPERERAYADGALAIGFEQTISQPWIVAAICQALELSGPERVLEIGTGSGYSACVLARLASEVLTVERIGELARAAEALVSVHGAGKVEVIEGDGSAGVEGRGPFEAIAVHATAPAPPRSLLAQLAPGGRLVVPIADERADMLTAFLRPVSAEEGAESFERRLIAPVRFVPLIGSEGFA
ncbi:MAG: protein-L-isoaspartate(D-aspartate) O-methyltransferase [bacterium]